MLSRRDCAVSLMNPMTYKCFLFPPDLSFNNIEVIEGLDNLVKLQDLSLYNNRISKIENLDTLQELQIFSIGNNNIRALENVRI